MLLGVLAHPQGEERDGHDAELGVAALACPLGIGQALQETRELLVLRDDRVQEVSDRLASRQAGAPVALLVEWSAYGAPTTVEWIFTPRADGTTFVSITNAGFTGDVDAVTGQVVSSTEGFTLVLAGAKALLEHGVRLNLVADRFPAGLEERSA